jgi:hypothetical protein
MLVAQYTVVQLTAGMLCSSNLSAFFKGRIEHIIPFEVPPVLLKKLGGWCSADLGWLIIVPADVPQAKH